MPGALPGRPAFFLTNSSRMSLTLHHSTSSLTLCSGSQASIAVSPLIDVPSALSRPLLSSSRKAPEMPLRVIFRWASEFHPHASGTNRLTNLRSTSMAFPPHTATAAPGSGLANVVGEEPVEHAGGEVLVERG